MSMTDHHLLSPNVYLSVICVILGFDGKTLKLLISDNQDTFTPEGKGICEDGLRHEEDLRETACRIITRHIGCHDIHLSQVGAYTHTPEERAHRAVSVAYMALMDIQKQPDCSTAHPQSRWLSLTDTDTLPPTQQRMVHDAIEALRKRIAYEPLGFRLLPELFTLTQLQHVYEAILGKEIDKRNFRKKIKLIDFIEKTDQIDKNTSKRGASLYRFNHKAYEECPTFKL